MKLIFTSILPSVFLIILQCEDTQQSKVLVNTNNSGKVLPKNVKILNARKYEKYNLYTHKSNFFKKNRKSEFDYTAFPPGALKNIDSSDKFHSLDQQERKLRVKKVLPEYRIPILRRKRDLSNTALSLRKSNRKQSDNKNKNVKKNSAQTLSRKPDTKKKSKIKISTSSKTKESKKLKNEVLISSKTNVSKTSKTEVSKSSKTKLSKNSKTKVLKNLKKQKTKSLRQNRKKSNLRNKKRGRSNKSKSNKKVVRANKRNKKRYQNLRQKGSSKNKVQTRRLIAARDAEIAEFPYVVSIQRSGQHWCSGALLNPRMVITTANCVWKSNRISRMRVRAGSTYTNTGGQVAKIQEVLKHPRWSIRSYPDNDVALLLLDRNIKFSDKVHAADLPNVNMLPAFDDAWITSWGSHRRDGVFESSSDPLQVYHAEFMSLEKCNNVTQRFGVSVTRNFICLAQTGKRAPCTRDTGAPATSDGIIWGLASWGIRKLCGTERFPAMFSYLASPSNMDFIINASHYFMSDERNYPYPDKFRFASVIPATNVDSLKS